ncbi:hypothetical protein A2U01_0110281, partial [Trifolium medium]|nr:hypothetical protein [Trifolium medium]
QQYIARAHAPRPWAAHRAASICFSQITTQAAPRVTLPCVPRQEQIQQPDPVFINSQGKSQQSPPCL